MSKYRFKNLGIIVLSFFLASFSYSQTQVTVNNIYENPSELLLKSKIIEFDTTLEINQLKDIFKTWQGVHFRNPEKVLRSETNSQIVINYIDQHVWNTGLGNSISSNHYQLIAQFKKGKIRLLLYDDGNVYIQATKYAPATAAHSTHFRNYFRNDSVITNSGFNNKAKFRNITSYIENNNRSFDSIIQGIINTKVSIVEKKDDW